MPKDDFTLDFESVTVEIVVMRTVVGRRAELTLVDKQPMGVISASFHNNANTLIPTKAINKMRLV